MIFSITQPKSQSYRTAQFEAILRSKEISSNIYFKKNDINNLTKQIYNKGVSYINNINTTSMIKNFSHKNYLHKPVTPTIPIQNVHSLIAKKKQAAEQAAAEQAAAAQAAAEQAAAAQAAAAQAAAAQAAAAQAAEQATQTEEPVEQTFPIIPSYMVQPLWLEKRALEIFPSTDYPDLSHCTYYNENDQIEKKLLVLFVYHIYNDRVKHFIDKCIFYHDKVDFIIIANTNKHYENTYFIDVPNKKNIKMLFRKNIGYDFGGWSDALLLNNLYKNYDNFIFVNSSVIGPFLKPDFKGKWTDIYIDGLKNNVKLFGSTINAINNSGVKTHAHVQSYIFSMDKITLKYLINCSIFTLTNYSKTHLDAIDVEVLMSRKIIKNKWNIGSLLKYYENVDFTFRTKKQHEHKINFLEDVMYDKYLKSNLWNEYEVVFIKGNRIHSTISI